MCIRPDIVLVVTQAVYDDAVLLSKMHDTLTNGYHDLCAVQIAEADREDRRQHWEMVKDFGLRVGCSPLASIEVGGVLMHRCDMAEDLPENKRVRLIIGDPATPPHEHGQGNISGV